MSLSDPLDLISNPILQGHVNIETHPDMYKLGQSVAEVTRPNIKTISPVNKLCILGC